MKQVRITIKGEVQGVFFRAFVKKEAEKLNLKGYVRNTDNGVEVVAQGKEEDIQRLIESCRKGPEGSQVDELSIEAQKAGKLSGFYVIY